MDKFNDFLGVETYVGDEIIFVRLHHRKLVKGIIKRITPKMVIITHGITNTSGMETKQYHDQVIKNTLTNKIK